MSQLNHNGSGGGKIMGVIQMQEREAKIADRASRELVVVSVHTTLGISGVTVAGARLSSEKLPGVTWIPMAVGEESDLTEEKINNSALAAVDPQCVVTWPKSASPLQQVMAVREALKLLGADVVVGHDAPVAYVACALEEARGMRSLLWHHSSGYDGDDVLLQCGALAHAWCGVSSGLTAHADGIMKHVNGERACVECAAVVVDVPERPVAWIPNTRTLRLVYCGRLANRHKRIMDLVTLADALVARGVRFHMTIAGDGPAGKMLRAACKPHLKAGRIALVGVVSPQRAIELYGAHDMGILVSESEGMPLTISECMAQGRPVAITTGCGGAVELVRDGENGIVVPIGDMEALADKLKELAHKRERIKIMGGNARETAATRMSIGTLRQTYLSMIHAAQGAPARMNGNLGAWWNRVVGALKFIGPCTPEDIDRLRFEVAGEVAGEMREGGGVVDMKQSLAAIEATTPLSAERLLRKAVSFCVGQGATRIMLYGAGAHARKVARVIAEVAAIVGVVDDAAEPQQEASAGHGGATLLAGKPVMCPSDACRLKFDAIVLCSDEFEEVLAVRAQAWCGQVPVVRLYGGWGHEGTLEHGAMMQVVHVDELGSQAA